ncbi:hypothetical protein PHSC3_000799 [Chlamydiales bacterium STE3]|nr:hypothetical protein PHSC3_000799 [Chlamydiales bacterium STE3]
MLMFGAQLATAFSYGSVQEISFHKTFQPATLSELQGVEWVKKCVLQYPEIHWLANVEVRKTEEGQATAQSPYSEQLFGQKFVEFDRTIMTLRCLQLVLDGSEKAYQEFTESQPKNVRLSRESFDQLHSQGIYLTKAQYEGISELEIIQAMEASLVLGDIGKSEKAREIFKLYGASAPDHDDFHEEVMHILERHPHLCPTFNRLVPPAKKLLIQTANLAHYGHVTHLEGGPSMFSKLKQSVLSSKSPFALDFDLFVHKCDVAGALGHVNNHSSLVYTELTHRAMQAVGQACHVLTHFEKTEMDAYNAYLAIRANWLGLDANDRAERVLTRIGAMLRLFNSDEGLFLKNSLLKLDSDQRAQIIAQLETNEGEELERTPTYMPAVLVNLSNNPLLGVSREERIAQTIAIGLPFLAKVLAKHRHSLAVKKADPHIPLNFNKVAFAAKEDPKMLLEEFTIDADGNVWFLGY